MNNVVDRRINKIQKEFKKYSSMILKSKYDSAITTELIQTYVDARYFNYNVDESINVFYRRIYDALKKRADVLIKKHPDKKEKIEDELFLFQYFFYFDFVRKTNDLEKVIHQIAEKRISMFNLRRSEDEYFESELMELVNDDLNQTLDEIERYYSKDFNLVLKKISPKKKDLYITGLKYNFKVPEIFNEQVVEETFYTDIIAEDKLFVEYPMIANEVFKDVLDGKFEKVYLLDFACDLFKKKKKLAQILEPLSSQAIQDKTSFVISFEEFQTNKNNIVRLMKDGYGFTLKTSKDMPKITKEETKILEIFDYILVDPEDVNKKKYNKKTTIEL